MMPINPKKEKKSPARARVIGIMKFSEYAGAALAITQSSDPPRPALVIQAARPPKSPRMALYCVIRAFAVPGGGVPSIVLSSGRRAHMLPGIAHPLLERSNSTAGGKGRAGSSPPLLKPAAVFVLLGRRSSFLSL